MFVELDGLFAGSVDSVDIDYFIDLSEIYINGEFPFKTPVHVVGEIFNHAGLVEIDADAYCTYTAMCDRCCEISSTELEFAICHELVVSLNNQDDDEYIVVPDMKLNLDELVTEDILLDLPASHLCSDDCKGLCSICGANLNKTTCDCTKPIDPRWEALLSFMDE